MNRTFITQINPRLDYSKAGENQVIVFPLRLQLFEDEDVQESLEIARQTLKDFDPDVDSLVLSGDPIAMSICVGILAVKFRSIELLKYDRRSEDYHPINISF